MKFHLVHKLLSYLLAASAVGMLLTTGTVPLTTVALLLVTGTLSWFVESGTRLGHLLDRAGLVFNIVALAFFGSSLYSVVRSFPEPDLSPILNLVLFLLVFKLFHRRSNRDYLQLYILSFLTVLAAAWLAQTVLFVVGFAAYVMLATWTLILFHLRHEIEDNYLVKHRAEASSEKVTAARVLNSRRVVGPRFFLVTGGVALTVMIGAGLVFMSIPRIGLGFLSGAVRRRTNVVGFSDEVRLGQHGVISDDNDTVVLRVQMPSMASFTDRDEREIAIGTLYWRGTVYDRYQNGEWVRSKDPVNDTPPLRELRQGDGGAFFLLNSGEEAPRTARQMRRALAGAERQLIQVVGLSFPVAFVLDRPVAYEMIQPPLGSFVTLDFEPRWSGEVALRPVRIGFAGERVRLGEFSGGQYAAYSMPPVPRVGAPPLSEASREAYLEVRGPLSPRVTRLAQRITQGRLTPMAKVEGVTEWLKRNKRYTVDLKRDPSVADPLEDFLFVQSAGHCEYFASAAAILLRLAGVPTRYVNGFLGGEWNDIGKHITVRDNRAHSWVEAHLDTFGWVRIDPTPVATRTSRMGNLRQLFDSMELFWSRWIILYDASRQIDIAKRIGRSLGVEGRRRNLPSLRPNKWTVAGVVAAIGLVFAIRHLRRRRSVRAGPARSRANSGARPVFRLYFRTLERLAGRGWPRQPWETPDEFAARLQRSAVPGAEVLQRLTDHYAAARYGEREIPPEIVAALAAEVEQIGREAGAEASGAARAA